MPLDFAITSVSHTSEYVFMGIMAGVNVTLTASSLLRHGVAYSAFSTALKHGVLQSAQEELAATG